MLTRFLGAILAVTLALAPALVEAKAGGGTSSGSRGSRTNQSAPATPTAPQGKPVERSATQQTQTTRPAQAPMQPAQQSFFQRNPFLGGLMGGLVGAGLVGLLFGHGLFGDGMGAAGMFGLLLQLALIGGVAWLVMSMIRRRGGAPAPAYAGAPGLARETWSDNRVPDAKPLDIATGRVGASTPAPAQGQDEIGLSETDFELFERMLGEIQGAWTRADVGAMRRLVTPEMLSYFSDQLADNASRSVENHVEDVKLEQGDLSESWHENGTDYATVAMRWTARDYTLANDGRVVEGSRTERSESAELWTFRRSTGGSWLLSAIQQV